MLDEVAHAVSLEIKALEVNVLVDDVGVALLLRVLRCRSKLSNDCYVCVYNCPFFSIYVCVGCVVT